jgi:hypothetical protein
MASGSFAGGYNRNRGGGGRAGRNGVRRLTLARQRRINEAYMAPSRSLRRGSGAAPAIPSRWLM